MHRKAKKPCILLVFVAITGFMAAHPIPDIPVVGKFDESGNATLTVAFDPRCLLGDPERVLFVTKGQLDEMPRGQREALLGQAQGFLENTIQVSFGGEIWELPQFEFRFQGREGSEFNEPSHEAEIRGHWSGLVSPGAETFQVRALEGSPSLILCKVEVAGLPRVDVQGLFPSEKSHPVDLTGVRPNSIWLTVSSLFRQGFVHVLPLGLDHILFVLGIFLLSRAWKPLILQVSAFTLAHTITLGMATLGWVNIPSKPVEVIIAGSICVVALQNIFRPSYTHNRLWVIFALGLVHGLGFAGALSDLELDVGALVAGLVGFNIGVEAGQLAVLLIAWTLTLPFIHPEDYRRMIVIPVSLCISAMGLYWVIERVSG